VYRRLGAGGPEIAVGVNNETQFFLDADGNKRFFFVDLVQPNRPLVAGTYTYWVVATFDDGSTSDRSNIAVVVQ
jgi:hypothetical protein